MPRRRRRSSRRRARLRRPRPHAVRVPRRRSSSACLPSRANSRWMDDVQFMVIFFHSRWGPTPNSRGLQRAVPSPFHISAFAWAFALALGLGPWALPSSPQRRQRVDPRRRAAPESRTRPWRPSPAPTPTTENVAGSRGSTPKRNAARNRPVAAASPSPTTTPITVMSTPCFMTRPRMSTRRRAERRAHTDLPRALSHAIREPAEQANHRR